YFQKREIENPRLNAEHLLAHALGCKRIELYLAFERELGEVELAPLRDLVRRRAQGEPLQHLLGTVEFCGQVFSCDRRALVPRPETEELVEHLLAMTWSANARIADVGTGSGVIALSVATRLPQAEMHATDLSAEALALARENAERLGLAGRVEFHEGSLLEPLDGTFDLIVANLPYVAITDRSTLSREVLHDPETALFAGPTGEELIRELIGAAVPKLRPGGLLALEIGPGQAEALGTFLADENYHDIAAIRDYGGLTRFLFARYG
ncbi:MAG: peptide chain release factor N(5)-glutamine methyltransferase, partial [Chthoniobacterales bacterium]